MDINGSNLKPQTGGLKLMTVFIAVLALHVVVIGGFTVYHLMSGGAGDSDMTTTDKTHKGSSLADGTLPDGTPADKTTPTPPTEVATIPANSATTATTPPATTPAPDAASPGATTAPATTPDAATVSNPASTPASTPTPTPAPAPATALTPAANLTLTTPAPTAATPAPTTAAANLGPQTPSGPISPDLAPPPEPAPIATPSLVLAPTPAPAPAPALATGPVHMPPPASSPEMHHAEHQEIYTVKITDSYKKIAARHHITVAQLKEANHIKGNVLHTGQKLIIPSERENHLVAESAPSATSTLSSAPSTPVLNESTAPMTTGLNSTSTTVASTGLHHHLYTVVKGDTLTKIAHRYKTTPAAIMAENGITDPTKLSIGKKLRIPSSEESRSARNTPPPSTQPSQVQAKGNPSTAQLANYAN